MSEPRTTKFRRNEQLEKLLSDLSCNLKPSEERLMEHYTQEKFSHPVILVMGPLRSGTTLFTQWLANTGLVCYPTNLLSRFYSAPILGAQIQKLLTDPSYNFRDELGEFSQQAAYVSENGKTKGVLAPNEFWYFWRRFLPEFNRDVWSDNELRQSMDVRGLLAELTGIMDVFGKPFSSKGMLFNYNIPFLDEILEKVIFVQIQRDPESNVASVLEARKRQLGDAQSWYSFKIPEYEELKGLPAEEQAAGQVCAINRAVINGLSNVAQDRKLFVHYEEFCANPKSVYEQLTEMLNVQKNYIGEKKFNVSTQSETQQGKMIRSALKKYL